MRHALRSTVTAVTATFCALAGLTVGATAEARSGAPAAQAGTRALYAPSDLVLAVGRGDDAASATVERAATLTCAPRPGGTHPDASRACAELASVGGRFGELARPVSDGFCTKEWAPVTLSAAGVWEGRRVTWSATYANGCTLRAALSGSAALGF
ncbi:protease inhibitor protein [Streptomyces sp. SID5785]|uniref:subtilase-type protease inhibitor n=1 Tax=Streptomyces sp. SID5785 TaxID=2690309 RepID=UPI00136177E6|nr:subtilase-type protease inhibitor [Streptomyces sp. SID5785]MZD07874.1 protease inhibitor protein [Streptomyces sp. SID5785]